MHLAWDEDLLAGYDAVVLSNMRGKSLESFRSLTGKGICRIMRREHPDAILLTALSHRFGWAVYICANFMRIPIWLRTETQDEAFARSGLKSRLRHIFYSLVYTRIKLTLPIGELNSAHFESHGVPRSKQICSPYCVVDRFQALSEIERSALRQATRSELGFGQQTILMFCGKLQPKKNPGILLEAMERMQESERRQFGLLFVGSGELEEELRIAAAKLGMPVRFVGFKNQNELPPYYLAADVLVLPSRQMGETWGLVVNEALLAERRVIVSKHVGCHVEFESLPSVKVFDGSVDDLLRTLRDPPDPGSTQGQRKFMEKYSVAAAARGIAQAMRSDSMGH